MAARDPNRESYFPAIEKKHGKPMSHWFAKMKRVAGKTYPEQMALLQGTHGFSRSHANALVMYTRGSKSTRRYESVDDYFAQLDEPKAKTVKKILKTITTKNPKLELVMAWNKPMLRLGTGYVFGVAVLKNHLLIAPWSGDVLAQFADRLADYKVNKKTIQVPVDWKVDAKLLRDIVRARIAELE